MTASIPLAWLGTYLIHSTLLLGVAWCASRLLRRRRSETALALEEGLWKGALVGALLTATLQVGLGVSAPGAALMPWADRAVAPRAESPTQGTAAVPLAAVSSDSVPSAGVGSRAAAYPLLDTPAALLPGWQRLALSLWLLGALAGTAWLAGSWIRLRRLLRTRAEIEAGSSRDLLDRLLVATRSPKPVRLTGSARLPVPVALGVLEREICLPRQAVDSLGPRRQSGLLAHELAHLERRDPAWLLAARAIESLLFVQPLNRLARVRLQEIAELRCDAWAVERTGDRTALARCLTEVAHWLTGGAGGAETAAWPPPAWSQLPTMASSNPKGIGLRVRRILEGPPATDRGDRSARSAHRWSLALPAVLLAAVAALAPGVMPILPDAPAAEAAPTLAMGSDEGDQDATATESSREAKGTQEKAERESREPERSVHVDQRVDRDVRKETDDSREVIRQQIPKQIQEQLQAVEEAHEEIAREVERSMAENQEMVQQLHRELAEQLAAAGDQRDLSPEERVRFEHELQRLSEQAQAIAERARPSQAELDRLRAEARRLSQEAMKHPAEIERLRSEAERLSRAAERTSRDVERMSDRERQRIEGEADRLATVVDQRMQRVEREELERHARALREQGASLEAQRLELEERMKALELRRQELEERFEAQQKAQERALEERREELDTRRTELEERHRDLLRETQERERERATREADESAAEGNDAGTAAEKPPAQRRPPTRRENRR